MKLHGSMTSPYVRKVRVLLDEKQLPYEFVRENPRALDSQVQGLTPLGKVPVLRLDNGRTMIDSPVILEYLDGLSGEPLLPARGEARWDVLHWTSLADGLLQALVNRLLEHRRPEAQRSPETLAWEERRIARVLDALAQADTSRGFFVGDRFSLADLAVGVALEYLDFRYPHDWRARYPALGAWLATISARPSFTRTTLDTVP
ncbi:glutathione S-transferase family protein [Melittangium boletus]|uniref:Glutathione S-transferase n=1 Tax=Melittangium boletus DSM 14713 TaxID=1294270 RepID=A0A250IS86_9BACT|nr:glutathione S-transferase N-terminal domain-containing protein [Melittangium boletus]ATB34112.1 glutathione S-transferase [Melittangium boletus DSM 14713]